MELLHYFFSRFHAEIRLDLQQTLGNHYNNEAKIKREI
jgi:hypothetical protein